MPSFMRDHILGPTEPLGRVTHHVTRCEAQGHGSLHAHIMLWIAEEDRHIPAAKICACGTWQPHQDDRAHLLHNMMLRKEMHACTPANQPGCRHHGPCKYRFTANLRTERGAALGANGVYQYYRPDVRRAKREKQRMRWCRMNPSKLRADQHRGLGDAYARGAAEATHVRHHVLLPSTFIGGPRHMQQLCQGSMAVVVKLGKPDLFMTMMCKTRWPQMQQELLPGQQADIVARALALKLKELLHDVKTVRGGVAVHMKKKTKGNAGRRG